MRMCLCLRSMLLLVWPLMPVPLLLPLQHRRVKARAALSHSCNQ